MTSDEKDDERKPQGRDDRGPGARRPRNGGRRFDGASRGPRRDDDRARPDRRDRREVPRGDRREGPRGDRRRDDRTPDGKRGSGSRNWVPREKRGPRREFGGERGPRREGGAPRREWKPRGEGRHDRRRDNRRDDRRDEIPQNEAQRRRAEVFAKKGPRKYGKDKPFADRVDRDERVIDEGSVKGKRFGGSNRSASTRRDGDERHGQTQRRPRRRDEDPFPTPPALDDVLAREVRKAVGDRRFDYVSRQLSRALVSYDAERYREAMSVLRPVLEDLWLINEVRVLAGRLEYRAQHWKAAAEHLEFVRGSDRADMTNMPVLIDCYRALKRYELVEQLWGELKESSPHPAIMAEGRVSAAMSHADRGDVQSAIRIMTHGGEPRQVQPHHLLEWYVLGDLYDRAGDPVTAKKYFVKVARHDAKYFDVEARLAGLGE
ncbi:MAG: hypothetical protein RIR38_798 [Actinomycetota bacterium]